jgi:flagellar FliJ protein
MDRMQLLATLLEREERRRDEALAAWRACQQQAEAARAQHEALLGYRSEYHARWTGQFRQGGSIELLRCYQGFVGRLDQAITMQDGQAQQSAAALERSLQQLRQRETRVAMVRKLIERRQAAAREQQARRDQKASDEAAQRLGQRRSLLAA